MIYNADTFIYGAIDELPNQKRRKGNQGRRNNVRKYKDAICAFDIETTNDAESMQAFMYHWQFQLNEMTVTGRTWEEFLRFMGGLAEHLKPEEYLVIFVHNLSFEFQFLRGIYPFEQNEVFAIDSRKVLKCEMMDHFEFRCSYLQTNMSLSQFTEKMGVTNKKLSGDEFDYSKTRYPWTPLTDLELEYSLNDVRGLVQAMEKQMSLEHDNLFTLPLTSTGYVRRDVRRAMYHFNWERLREMLPDYEIFQMLRDAFRGGNTHCSRFWAGLIVNDVTSYDRVSSYPDVQLNCLFPMGPWIHEPEADIDRVLRKIYRQHRACLIRIALWDVRLTDPGWGCPYIPKAKCRIIRDAEIDNGRVLSAGYLELCVTDVDLGIILDEYSFSFMDVQDFAHCRYGPLPKPLRDTVMSYFRDKTELKGVPGQDLYYMKQKNKLNSVYGMSVMNPCRGNIDFIDGEFILRSDSEADLLDYANKHAFQNYAWGVWTTAHARAELEKAIKLAGDNFIYCDTDSVKYAGVVDFTQLNADLEKRSKGNGAFAQDPAGNTHYLGVWEYDAGYSRFCSWGAKKYAYTFEDGSLGVTIAGVNKTKGAAELAAHGGLSAFKPGFIFRTSAGTESIYNDTPDIKYITREGRRIPITSNLYMYDSEYTLGITGEYMRILERAEEWKKATEKY